MKVITGRARLSYAHLTTPFKDPEDPPEDARYSVTILIPKSDEETLKKLRKAEEDAIAYGIKSKWGGERPHKVKSVIKDGDNPDDFESKPGEEVAGHWVFTARSKSRPGIVDRDLNPILDATEIYSGMYGRVSVSSFPYTFKGSKGTSFALNNVQKVADGEPLGFAKVDAEDEFDTYSEGDKDLL